MPRCVLLFTLQILKNDFLTPPTLNPAYFIPNLLYVPWILHMFMQISFFYNFSDAVFFRNQKLPCCLKLFFSLK